MSSSRSVVTPNNPTSAATVVVKLRGKEYVVCNERQMRTLLDQRRQFILLQANDNKDALTPEQVDAMLESFRAECGYDTMEHLMSIMNCEEQRQWRDNYRFSGIRRAKAE